MPACSACTDAVVHTHASTRLQTVGQLPRPLLLPLAQVKYAVEDREPGPFLPDEVHALLLRLQVP